MTSNSSPKKKNDAKVSVGSDKNRSELAETLCAAANEAFLDGEFEDAFDKFQRAVRLDPKHCEARVGLGKIWLEFEEYERAYEEADCVLKQSGERADAFELRGHASRLLGNFKSAVEDYDKAIALDKRAYVALYGRAIVRDMLGDTDAALGDFRACLAIEPEFVSAYYDRGVLLANENKLKEAIEDYSKALELDPEFVHCYVARGEAYTELNQPRRALQDFNDALELDPNAGDAYYYRAAAKEKLGDARGAKEDKKSARELGFDDQEA